MSNSFTRLDLRPQSSKDRSELFALSRALSFTRRALRLRSRAEPATSDVLAAVSAEPALTPWDLIGEDDTEGGVAFTLFQKRSEPEPAQSVA